MPQTATIEIKAKAGKEELADKSEYEIGGYAAVADVVVCAHRKQAVDLYAGPLDGIDAIILKSDSYKPVKCADHEYDPIQADFNDAEKWFDLKAPLFLGGPAIDRFFKYTVSTAKSAAASGEPAPVPDAIGNDKDLRRVTIDNRMPQDVKISVLVVRKKADAENGANCSGSGCP